MCSLTHPLLSLLPVTVLKRLLVRNIRLSLDVESFPNLESWSEFSREETGASQNVQDEKAANGDQEGDNSVPESEREGRDPGENSERSRCMSPPSGYLIGLEVVQFALGGNYALFYNNFFYVNIGNVFIFMQLVFFQTTKIFTPYERVGILSCWRAACRS